MIIKSDWHIHSEYSYDAANLLSTIGDNAKAQGLYQVSQLAQDAPGMAVIRMQQ